MNRIELYGIVHFNDKLQHKNHKKLNIITKNINKRMGKSK